MGAVADVNLNAALKVKTNFTSLFSECGEAHRFGTPSTTKTSRRCDFVSNIWLAYTIHVPAHSRTNTHSHVPNGRIQWTDKSIRQLSMQCHVRTVCSTISTQSHWGWPLVHLWLLLGARQRNRNRLQTRTKQTAAGLQSGAVRAQWSDRMVLWRWCSEMLVCGSRQQSICGKTVAVDSSRC